MNIEVSCILLLKACIKLIRTDTTLDLRQKDLDAHQQTNGLESYGTYTQWNITQSLKRIHLDQFQ